MRDYPGGTVGAALRSAPSSLPVDAGELRGADACCALDA